jgi:hypothetical protein
VLFLKKEERITYDRTAELAKFVYEIEKGTQMDDWMPTTAERTQLAAIPAGEQRGYAEKELYLVWKQGVQEENAKVKVRNDTMKKAVEFESTQYQKRDQTVNTFIGALLADMTADSRDKVTAWQRTIPSAEADVANRMEEAYLKHDWFFIIEATRATHLLGAGAMDEAGRFRQQLHEKNRLMKLVHTSGTFTTWLRAFRDLLMICKTAEIAISEAEAQHLHGVSE